MNSKPLYLVGTMFSRYGPDEFMHVYSETLDIVEDSRSWQCFDDTGQGCKFLKSDWNFKATS